MARLWQYLVSINTLFTSIFIINLDTNAFAQSITLDGTLGTPETLTGPNYLIPQTAGQAVGNNLFHSFGKFNLNSNEAATFQSNPNIQNILSRVTGGNQSVIDGLIRTQTGVNLFFINPSGMIFGQNARLDVGGSFVASTASSINFADGTRFTTSHQQTNPLLTVSVPIGLQLGENPTRILVQGDGRGIRTTDSPVVDLTNGLRVAGDRTLALVGGNLDFDGGTLKTAGGRLELGSVAGSSLVSLNATDKGFSLGYAGVSNFGDIQLSGTTSVDASGLSGGEINIIGKRVTIKDGSQIESTTLNVGTGGKLTVTASELVELSGTSPENRPSSLSTDNRASGRVPGELTINTRQLILRPGGRISASNSDTGLGGNITIHAADVVELIGTFTSSGGLRSSGLSTQTTSRGNSGNLMINTKKLSIRDGAEISASTYGAGNGGNIMINASEVVELTGISNNGNTTLFSRIVAEAGNNIREVNRNAPSAPVTGKGGNLSINTRQLIVKDEARLTVSSRSENRNAQGAGSLDVKANNILLDNKGQIAATTFIGQGGNIKLEAQEFLVMRRNSKISTAAGTARAGGDGGNININGKFIVAVPNENSDISANAFTGTGGKVTISATGIYGITPRSREELVKLLGTNEPQDLDPAKLLTSDISAISQTSPTLSGDVILNTPDLDPSRGLTELPTNLIDVSQQIAQGCTPKGKTASHFISTGRGGLPLNPDEPLRGRAVITNWVTLGEGNQEIKAESTQQSAPETIVEAQGWIINADGKVELVASVPSSGYGGRSFSCDIPVGF
jgi:filamentous hemagglutinin family protein